MSVPPLLIHLSKGSTRWDTAKVKMLGINIGFAPQVAAVEAHLKEETQKTVDPQWSKIQVVISGSVQGGKFEICLARYRKRASRRPSNMT